VVERIPLDSAPTRNYFVQVSADTVVRSNQQIARSLPVIARSVGDEAIQTSFWALDCSASLAMTETGP
jgi:hypothetical protein